MLKLSVVVICERFHSDEAQTMHIDSVWTCILYLFGGIYFNTPTNTILLNVIAVFHMRCYLGMCVKNIM